jgi:hypothetical protein
MHRYIHHRWWVVYTSAEYVTVFQLPGRRLSPAHTLCRCKNHASMRARAYSSALGSARSFQQRRRTRMRVGCWVTPSCRVPPPLRPPPADCPTCHLRLVQVLSCRRFHRAGPGVRGRGWRVRVGRGGVRAQRGVGGGDCGTEEDVSAVVRLLATTTLHTKREYTRLQTNGEECDFFVFACGACWRVSPSTQKPHPHLNTVRAGDVSAVVTGPCSIVFFGWEHGRTRVGRIDHQSTFPSTQPFAREGGPPGPAPRQLHVTHTLLASADRVPAPHPRGGYASSVLRCDLDLLSLVPPAVSRHASARINCYYY